MGKRKPKKTRLELALERIDPKIPRRRCRRCGTIFKDSLTYEQDTWHLGDFGCTLEDCPITSWETTKQWCPVCSKELSDRVGSYRKIIITQMEAEGYGETDVLKQEECEV